MGFVRSSLSIAAATAVGAGVFIAAPAAQGADYPPTKPVRCGAAIRQGSGNNDIAIKIRPLRDPGYKFQVQRRKKPGKWKIVRTGRTKASNGKRLVKNVKKGIYRVRCIGAPTRLDGITSAGRVR